jgi:beta-glucuronidase
MKTYKPIILWLLFAGLWSLTITAFAQQPLIQNMEGRYTTSLNGSWHYIIDQYETGFYDYRYNPHDNNPNVANSSEAIFNDALQTNKTQRLEYGFADTAILKVPGSWNSQLEKLNLYEGTIWYRKKFDYKKTDTSSRVFVHFGGVNYEAHVYLNGQKMGVHIGGFTPFNFEITEFLKEKDNSLIVKVDNKRKREGVPTSNFDWFNYGGILRDVNLVEVPETYICQYQVQLKKNSFTEIQGFIQLAGKDLQGPINISIPALKLSKNSLTDVNGRATFSLTSNKIEYWSPENPKLYEVIITCNNTSIREKIGFRTIETRGADILLNGQSIFLRGISIHEENGLKQDRATTREDAAYILGKAKELNCNFVRLAHYPHNAYMIEVAEELGLMVWEEIPVYWTIQWENEQTYANAENQLTEVINRDRNRANVIIWSVANETPVSAARTHFLIRLIQHVRMMDSTRLISAALEKHTLQSEPLTMVIDDPFAENVDILSFNQYVGWYDGLPEKAARAIWDIKINKPVFISEFGGGALYGYHGTKDTRWTEEFQEELYKQNINMLDKIPSLRGMSPWILFDFRSPRRMLPVVQDGWNRKGVLSEKGEKKKAFYIMKAYYQKKEKEFLNKEE